MMWKRRIWRFFHPAPKPCPISLTALREMEEEMAISTNINVSAIARKFAPLAASKLSP